MKRIISIVGTRPEAIKMAPVIRRLATTEGVRAAVCVTAQHRAMLDGVLRAFDIRPDYDLDLMSSNQKLSDLTARVLQGVDRVIDEFQPDFVVVHGDTSTTLGAALAAFYRRIPVAHVEAGLRTGDLSRPWPEEMNRRVVDSFAQFLFAPTERARQNLLTEGLQDRRIAVTGNTAVDAILDTLRIIERETAVGAPSRCHPQRSGQQTLIVTAHRRESFGADLDEICRAIHAISNRSDVNILFPVHQNPNVREIVHRRLGGVSNIRLTEPLDYFDFVRALKSAHLVITDSGGIQEEAPSLGKPVLVVRNVTERPEAIEAGTARLVGTSSDRIVAAVQELLDDEAAYKRMARAHNPFGDGHASERIIAELVRA